jgi:RNA recognition motif-containing protein
MAAVVRATFWETEEASLWERALMDSRRPRSFSDSWLEVERWTEILDSDCEECISLDSASTREGSESETDASPRESQSSRRVSWSDVTDSDTEAASDRRRLSRREGHARRPDLWRAEAEESPLEATQTTLVLKNLPLDTSRGDLCRLLEREGFEEAFNFLYVPMNFKAMKSFCYAFVNFVDHITAVRAMSHLHGFAWDHVGSQTHLEAAWSQPHQGLQVHIERFRNSPVMHPSVPDEYKPILLQDGVRAAFPEPTGKVVAPRELRRQCRSRDQ